MNSSTPLAYDSLKSVLRRMDPNLRLKLSHRIPGIRVAEKSVPLFMEVLAMGRGQTQIEKTVYEMFCVQPNPLILTDWQEELISEYVRTTGVHYDLTRYGICDYSMEDKRWDGDVALPRSESQSDVRERVEEDLEELDEMMAMRMDDLTEDSPGTYLIFKVSHPDNKEVYAVEHLDYSRSLAEASKYMNSKLLGGRRHFIRVKECYDGCEVLRIPVGIRLKVSVWTFITSVEETLKAFAGIIEKDSFPLKQVFMEGGFEVCADPENYLHPVVQAAEHFQIECPDIENLDWVEVILSVTNLIGHFECAIRKEDIMFVLLSWMSVGQKKQKPIGFDWSFGVEREEDASDLMARLKKLVPTEEIVGLGCKNFPDILVHPLEADSEMLIYFCDNHLNPLLQEYYRWELNIRVTSKGHRHLLNINFEDDVFK